MSILQTIFGSKPAVNTAQPQQQQQQQGQPPQPQAQAPQQEHINANNTVPNPNNTQQQLPTPQTPNPESPNDKYAQLWDTSNLQAGQAPNFKLPPEKLQQVTSGLDFTKSIQQADLEKIAQGGVEAVGALQSILTSFGQDLFAKSAQFSAHMTESGYNVASQGLQRDMPTMVRNQLASNELYAGNEKLRNPALKPLMDSMQSQFAAKFPSATAQEINSMVTDYMSTVVAGAFAPTPTVDPRAKSDGAQDFSSFVS